MRVRTSVDWRPMTHYKLRVSGATSGDFRFYAFAGIGYTRVAARSVGALFGAHAGELETTAASSFIAPNVGLGLEVESVFVQFRLPPRPRASGTTPAQYGVTSLGYRF